MNKKKLEKELREVINRNSIEGKSNTPDFVLAKYLINCLDIYAQAVNDRDKFSEHQPKDNKTLT